MKGKTGKVNVELAGDTPGSFVGEDSHQEFHETAPRKARGPKRVSGDNFHASGESTATSISAARKPTYWRRGGFVTAKFKRGGVVPKRKAGGRIPRRQEGGDTPAPDPTPDTAEWVTLANKRANARLGGLNPDLGQTDPSPDSPDFVTLANQRAEGRFARNVPDFSATPADTTTVITPATATAPATQTTVSGAGTPTTTTSSPPGFDDLMKLPFSPAPPRADWFDLANKLADARQQSNALAAARLGGLRPVLPYRWTPQGPVTGMKRGGVLSMKQRKALPSSSFALPGKGKGPSGKGAGSYPIPDASHARNALSRVSQFGSSGEKAAVRAKVKAKFPGIGKK